MMSVCFTSPNPMLQAFWPAVLTTTPPTVAECPATQGKNVSNNAKANPSGSHWSTCGLKRMVQTREYPAEGAAAGGLVAAGCAEPLPALGDSAEMGGRVAAGVAAAGAGSEL